MTTAVLTERALATAPRTKARIAGVFFLLTIATGVFAQGFISERLIQGNDAAMTATNILTHRALFQLGFAVYLIEMVCNIAITSLFYELLKPVSRSLSLLAAFIGLAGCIIKTLSRLFYIAPLLMLGGASYLKVFNPDQLQALALLFLKVNDRGAGIALAFFGFSTVLKGYLIFKSTFLPRILGVFSITAGFGWLTFLSPDFGLRMFPYTASFGLLVSIAMILWLLVKGLDEQRWNEQAKLVGVQI